MPRVFISYSHKDEGWKDKLLPHLKTLEQAGMGMVVWQDRQIDAGEKWHPAIQDAMADAVATGAPYLGRLFVLRLLRQRGGFRICWTGRREKGFS